MNNRQRNCNAIKWGATLGLAGSIGGGYSSWAFTGYAAQIASWAPANKDMDAIVKEYDCSWDFGKKYTIVCPPNGTVTARDLMGKAYGLEDFYAKNIWEEYSPYAALIGGAVVGVAATVGGARAGFGREADLGMPSLVESNNGDRRPLPSPSTPLITSEHRSSLSRCYAALFSSKPSTANHNLDGDIELGRSNRNTLTSH